MPLNNEELDAIAKEIEQGIDEAILAQIEPQPRKHLGASVIGHECKAHLWFSFRWANQGGKGFDARMQRLFARGHLEEFRLVKFLRDAGWTVEEYDTSVTDKQQQWRFSACNGHFGGSSDGKAYHEKYPELGKLLTEYKTHNTKHFVTLKAKGVQLTQPKHVAQMHIYGYAFEHDYGLYFPINKNDDDIAIEIIKLDKGLGESYVHKAELIINSPFRPEKVAKSETYPGCKYCEFADICWGRKTMAQNCRSCRYVKPTEGGTFTCTKFARVIPDDFIPQGCGQWEEAEH